MNRIHALKQVAFKNREIDSIIIFSNPNLTYFTGFSGAMALLIPERGDCILYVQNVNFAQAKEQVHDLTVELRKPNENLMDKIVKQAASTKKIGVDTLQIESWQQLARAAGGEEKLVLSGNLVRELRKIKDGEEISSIREACRLAQAGMQAAFETVKPGVREMEVATQIEFDMRKNGSYGTAFDTIVASGPSSAFPHGSCSDRVIQEGDFVVVDLGATYKFYRSDMTRTFIAGKASEKQKKIYDTVIDAQDKAFKALKPNITGKEVDTVARQFIETAGFNDYFSHGLGHGVGLDIHEPPTLSQEGNEVLNAGNVVTVEPGIYIPGFGGVRIEDTALVTKEGAEKLTSKFYSLQTGK